jgi:hypothetical protein
VRGDVVPGRGDLGGQAGGGRGHRSQHEERRADVSPREQVEKVWCRPGVGAVVKGQRDVPGVAVAREPAG